MESRNLAAANPERVKEMSAKWELWAQRTRVFPRPEKPEAGVKRMKN
jgi:hypothetical protein